MNLQVERIAELTTQLQLPGVENLAVSLAQQAAKEEWDYLQFLESILKAETQSRQ
jgi:DNA replication protein DnaC